MKRILWLAFVTSMTPVWLAAGMLLFFGPPVALVWETVCIMQFRGRTPAAILRVDVEGQRGRTRPDIEYEFFVAGRRYQSNQFLPSPLGNYTRWTGGASEATRFAVGQNVIIRYDPSDPTRSCLVYGWHKGPVIFVALLWGQALLSAAASRRWLRNTTGVQIALIVCAALLMILPASVIPVGAAPFYVGCFCGVVLVLELFVRIRDRKKLKTEDLSCAP